MKLKSMIFYEGISIVGLCSIDIEILKVSKRAFEQILIEIKRSANKILKPFQTGVFVRMKDHAFIFTMRALKKFML